MKKFKSVLSCFLICSASFLSLAELSYAQERTPVSIEEGSPLPLRILTRPHAVLYADETGSKVTEGQLPVFKPYFVYTRPGGESRETGTGWYEVGTDDKGTVAGWIKASDVFEWKQTMCLAYSHPEGRKPVLMFEDDYELDTLLKEMPDQRVVAVEKLYTDIDNAATTPLPKDFPVISVEPKLAVDISKQFYLLPILEHETIQMESYEGRKLLLAAVTANAEKERKTTDIRENTEYVATATASEDEVKQSNAGLLFDIVWVMDTTRSMQPYIEEVRNILQESSKTLGSSETLSKHIAFGVWGYRDSESIKDIGYQTKNFTPELQPIDTFLTTIAEVKETTTDSVDVNEDLFAGVHDAITKTAWREGSQRFIIVVGDAPAHELGHKWNSSNLDEKTLRTLANESDVTIVGIHVRPERLRKKYNNLAKRQFEGLTMNPGMTEALTWSLSSSNRANFSADTKNITSTLAKNLESRLVAANIIKPEEQVVVVEEVKVDTSGTSADDIRPDTSQLDQALKAASVTWLGSAANVEPPSDVEAWVTDKDLMDPSIQALDIRLLISKRQIDTLAIMLNDIIMAGTESQMTSDDFFTSLQSVSATASRNADQLAQAQTLQDSGLVPSFLEGLPYESQIMSMSADLWASLGPDEQDQFIESLRAKVAAYQSLNETPDQWIALNQGDAADDYVTPIPLDLLP